MAMSIKVSNVNKTFSEANKEINKLVNSAQRISAIQASSSLKFATPVDTGRARGSWILTKTKGQFKDANEGFVTTPYLGPIPSDTLETLYLTNGTPYIQELNQGSSLQAPPRFIENTIAKYFKVNGSSITTF